MSKSTTHDMIRGVRMVVSGFAKLLTEKQIIDFLNLLYSALYECEEECLSDTEEDLCNLLLDALTDHTPESFDSYEYIRSTGS